MSLEGHLSFGLKGWEAGGEFSLPFYNRKIPPNFHCIPMTYDIIFFYFVLIQHLVITTSSS